MRDMQSKQKTSPQRMLRWQSRFSHAHYTTFSKQDKRPPASKPPRQQSKNGTGNCWQAIKHNPSTPTAIDRFDFVVVEVVFSWFIFVAMRARPRRRVCGGGASWYFYWMLAVAISYFTLQNSGLQLYVTKLKCDIRISKVIWISPLQWNSSCMPF